MKKLTIFIIAVMFGLVLFVSGKAYADNLYYNNYYVGVNGGVSETAPSGLSSKSGGTYNITLGKNVNMNNIVIGGGVLLGYANNGNYSGTSVNSVYYGAFVKGGYAFNNIMPFVKLGYIGTSFNASNGGGNSTESGLLYGAGVEYMFNPTWGVTAQYLGTSLSNGSNGFPNIRVNNYMIGLDFNF
ncbi:MAG: outer membrane protein [bacterium]